MITTPRLTLRHFTAGDLPFLETLHGDPEVVRFLGAGTVRTRAENLTWLGRTLASYPDGLGQLVVCDQQTGAPIGRCGLSRYWVVREGPFAELRFDPEPGARSVPSAELGYTFLRSHWGMGYATEAARAVLARAFETLRLPRVISLIRVGNEASFRVSRKLGFQAAHPAAYQGLPCLVMARARDVS